MLGIIDDPIRAILVSAMDARALRNRVIADNIANADTPGFQRNYVEFEDALNQAIADGAQKDSNISERLKPVVHADNTPSARLDGNNVNIDTEMADLARNSIEYNALVELIRLKGQIRSTVINGGPR